MIRINFFRSGGLITGFECKGHSNTADYGNDIVCAFVSSACYMVANTVTDVMGLNADATATDGYMRLCINDNAAPAQDILNGLVLHFNALATDYPDNVKTSITEV